MAFVHHTVTANDYTPDQSASIVLGIAKYHRDTNGWNDIGYNFLVDQYGQVFEGRAGGVEQAVIGAQAQGYNSQSTGVAVLGTFSDVPIPEAAMAAITQLLGWKLSLHGVPCEGGLTIVSGGGSLNRYPSGTPVAMQRISGHRDGDKHRVPRRRPLRPAARAAPPRGGAGRPDRRPRRGEPAAVGRRHRLRRRRRLHGHGHPPRLDRGRRRGRRAAEARRGRRLGDRGAHARPWSTARGSCACRGGAAATCARLAAGVTSKAIAVQVTPALTTRSAPKRVSAGSSLALSGRVRPSVAVAVLLEREGADGKFHRVRIVSGTRRLTTWRAAVRLRRPGLYRLTARTAAKDGNVRGRAVYVRAVRAHTGGSPARPHVRRRASVGGG